MHIRFASFLIFIFDVLAFLVAFVVSGIIARYIAVDILGGHYIGLPSDAAIIRFYNFSLLSIVALFVFYNRGHYIRRIPFWNQVRYVIIVLFTMMLIDGFIQFASKSYFSRLWISISWILSFFMIMTARQMAVIIGKKIGIWDIRTIIIGDGSNIIEAAFAICSESYTGYNVTDIIVKKGSKDFDKESLPAQYKNINIIFESGSVDSFISKNKNCFYVIAPNSFSSFNIEDMVGKINDTNSFYAVVPPIEGMQLYGVVPQYFFGHDIMLLSYKRDISSPFGSLIKRIIDIVVSGLSIAILAPLFLFIALLVKKDGGSAFYGQERIGRNNKKFKCLKFRSMAVDAEERLQGVLNADPKAKEMWETHRKLLKDPRVTKIGAKLRSMSLDELPQLINVFIGDMSLVGPRPILPDEVVFFNKKELSNYISIRPGITGLWQVSGRNDVSFKQRVHFDNWYVQNWSLWCDVVIIIKTFVVIIRRVGVY